MKVVVTNDRQQEQITVTGKFLFVGTNVLILYAAAADDNADAKHDDCEIF